MVTEMEWHVTDKPWILSLDRIHLGFVPMHVLTWTSLRKSNREDEQSCT
jgi:hypothetical protein